MPLERQGTEGESPHEMIRHATAPPGDTDSGGEGEAGAPLRQRAARAVVWAAARMWGGEGASALVFLLLARLLAPEAFGLVALAMVYITFVQVLVAQGFSDAIVQRERLEPEHLDSAFWASLGIGSTLAIISVVASRPIAHLLDEARLTPIIGALSVIFLLTGLRGVQEALLRRSLDFRTLAVRTLAATLVGGFVGVGMALSGYGVWSLVGQRIAHAVVSVLALWTTTEWRPGVRVSKRHLGDLLTFSLYLSGARILTVANRRSPDLLIGYFLGPIALGYYTVGFRLVRVVLRVVRAVTTQVALPTFSQLQTQPNRLRRGLCTATQLTSLLSFPTFVAAAALAPDLVPAWFGDRWVASVPVMQILSIFGAVQSIASLNGVLLIASGRVAWQMRLVLFNTVLTAIVLLLAVRYGIVAVAGAVLFQVLLSWPLSTMLVRKVTSLRWSTYVKQLLPPVAASLVTLLLIVGLRVAIPDSVPVTLVFAGQLALGVLAYAAVVYALSAEIVRQAWTLFRLGFTRTSPHG